MSTEGTRQKDVGEIAFSRGPSASIEWKIRHYFGFPQEVDRYFNSPTFSFLDSTWVLRLYPNGQSADQSTGWISLYLTKKNFSSQTHHLQFSLGIMGFDDSIYTNRRMEHTFERTGETYGWRNYIKVKDLGEKSKDIVPNGVLTVVCSLNANEGVHAAVQTETTPSTWQTRIAQLYATKENADVRFVVNGRIFEAHRFVLSMRSPVFSRILITANEAVCTHIVDAESVTEAAVDILLRFLYTDTLGTTDKQSIIEAYLCALAYQVADLQDKCKEEIEAWDIITEEIFSLLDVGLDVPALKDKCMRLLQTEGRSALSHPTFLKISSKCLRCVLEGGVLENVPVFERIERVIEWCGHPHAEGTDYADARNKLLDSRLLGRLEFEKLELQDLSIALSRYQGLITPEELMCFLKYKRTKDSSVLPDWCLPEPTAYFNLKPKAVHLFSKSELKCSPSCASKIYSKLSLVFSALQKEDAKSDD